MSALGHYLEARGLPSVSVSLVREHTAAIRPPRALWVSFELGRPLGSPGDAAFQRRVLTAALGLLERTDTPVLADFPEDAPASGSDEEAEGWACPVSFPKPDDGREATPGERVLEEVERLRPWHDRAIELFGKTTVGLSGLDIEDAVAMLEAYRAEGRKDAADSADEFRQTFKYALDDMLAFYQESANAQPGRQGSSQQVLHWFWTETEAGAFLLAVREAAQSDPDRILARVAARNLIPQNQQARMPG